MQITIGDRTEMVNFFHTHKRGVDRIFVDHPLYLSKVGVSALKLYSAKVSVWSFAGALRSEYGTRMLFKILLVRD